MGCSQGCEAKVIGRAPAATGHVGASAQAQAHVQAHSRHAAVSAAAANAAVSAAGPSGSGGATSGNCGSSAGSRRAGAGGSKSLPRHRHMSATAGAGAHGSHVGGLAARGATRGGTSSHLATHGASPWAGEEDSDNEGHVAWHNPDLATFMLQYRDLRPEDFDLLCKLDEGLPKRGLAPMRVVDRLPRLHAGDCDASECGVCLASLPHEALVVRLNCQHVFHAACIKRWLTECRGTCPLCSAPVVAAGSGDSSGEDEDDDGGCYAHCGVGSIAWPPRPMRRPWSAGAAEAAATGAASGAPLRATASGRAGRIAGSPRLQG
mmetsp:Transcript_15347/g.43543  ORF Transcript_15347/g.43543 Transcript_15347/m.43543 type:complete len:320 (-) Transcript_15347:124-1083(-)